LHTFSNSILYEFSCAQLIYDLGGGRIRMGGKENYETIYNPFRVDLVKDRYIDVSLIEAI